MDDEDVDFKTAFEIYGEALDAAYEAVDLARTMADTLAVLKAARALVQEREKILIEQLHESSKVYKAQTEPIKQATASLEAARKVIEKTVSGFDKLTKLVAAVNQAITLAAKVAI